MEKQIYHPYWNWEDYKNGMWSKVKKKDESIILHNAINFTGNHILYGKAMINVIENWPIACENNLTNTSINRKAWIGQAACNFEFKWPEYLIRKAWWCLTNEQRNLADNEAIIAIKIWEQKQKLKITLKHGSKGVIIQASQMKLQMN